MNAARSKAQLPAKGSDEHSGAAARALSLILEKSARVQAPAVRAYVDRLRRKSPEASPAQIVTKLEKQYLATVMASGAAVGSAAALPGIGTLTALSAVAGETVVFLEATSLFVLAVADGGYTANFPLSDLIDGKAWVVYGYDGEDLEPEHGGPARLLVPHLYFWKSAKWVRGLLLRDEDEPGFWESLGYHNYGDPWRQQRYWGD